ncbi:MAG: C-GCAxxG-C-C family protein [Bacteroidales bacterium]|nr:C-GCAxxG-C-C family protein [Bacteroidales bacterium]
MPSHIIHVIMNKKEKALSYFSNDFTCSQSIFAAYAPDLDIPEIIALKVAAPFGSGMRKAETCGCCTGALMVIGSKYGYTNPNDKDQRAKNNELTALFLDEFAKANGSCLCRELLHCNISTPDGLAYARENNLFTTLCPKLVASAVDILEKITK